MCLHVHVCMSVCAMQPPQVHILFMTTEKERERERGREGGREGDKKCELRVTNAAGCSHTMSYL